ncbi:hypothetical protein Q3G72_024621 [Acer saccharum]|nr:hypothetical protein Q3G72_024621 [Acer saccharum]
MKALTAEETCSGLLLYGSGKAVDTTCFCKNVDQSDFLLNISQNLPRLAAAKTPEEYNKIMQEAMPQFYSKDSGCEGHDNLLSEDGYQDNDEDFFGCHMS